MPRQSVKRRRSGLQSGAEADRAPLDEPCIRRAGMRVEDEGGFGFVDTDNNPVIPSQFLWAGDFHEGRAEVQTRPAWG